MKHKSIAVKIYLINLALLATHEIDSAFWHEWKLFNLPGGIDVFLVLNLLLLLFFMYGFEKVVRWKKGSVFFSYFLAFSGIFAFAIHSFFILNNHPEFNSTISLAILILAFITSVAQIILLLNLKNKQED